jgi:hypothetical protein
VSDESTNAPAQPPLEEPRDTRLDPGDETLDPDRLEAANAILEETRRRLAEVPAEVVITNHIMGLYELAAIHLGASPPDLQQAKLSIDAVACLVDGLGDRIGPDAGAMRDALSNIRLAFVQVKKTVL